LSTLGLPILGSPKLDLPVPGALCASIALVVLMSTWAAYAERLLSRTDTDQDGNFIVQFVDVARDGDSIVVGPPGLLQTLQTLMICLLLISTHRAVRRY